MICQKCKTQFSDSLTFCPNCGESIAAMKKQSKMKMRKEYNAVVFVVITIWVDAFLFGIADLYAGYIKAALIKFSIIILSFALFIATNQASILLILGISFIFTLTELISLSKKTYLLENGQRVELRPLDIRYDPKGVDNLLKATYGCGISNIRRLY